MREFFFGRSARRHHELVLEQYERRGEAAPWTLLALVSHCRERDGDLAGAKSALDRALRAPPPGWPSVWIEDRLARLAGEPPSLSPLVIECEGRSIPVTSRAFLIGKSLWADLQIASPYIARAHALVEWTGQSWVLRNLGATNPVRDPAGTVVTECPIDSGDSYVLGAWPDAPEDPYRPMRWTITFRVPAAR